jgi:phospholipid/cholesterol/gamma-HCH transport system substrate-binding protein
VSESVNAQTKDLPQINEKVTAILTSLEGVMNDLGKLSPELPKITRDVSATTASVPVVIGMTQQTLAELEMLLRQLRSHWLLGGGGEEQAAAARLPTREVRP